MMYRTLYFLVEGDDDERFINWILKPLLESRFHWVQCWKYGKTKRRKVIEFLRAVKSMGGGCFYLTDMDSSPCITARKQHIIRTNPALGEHSVIVVVREMESWLLAGLDEEASRKLRIPYFRTTDAVTKEQFDRLVPARCERIEFIHEVLRLFSVETARQKNRSFSYLMDRLACA